MEATAPDPTEDPVVKALDAVTTDEEARAIERAAVEQSDNRPTDDDPDTLLGVNAEPTE